MEEWIADDLAKLKSQNLYRKLRVLEDFKGTQATVDGKRVTLFCGNDYLGLSQHPKVIEAAERALRSHGAGAGASRLISGTSDLHDALEKKIAAFLGKERALVFSSGYLANLGTISALAGKDDLVILDKLCHASLIDAAKLSGAAVRVFPHKNLDYLERLLSTPSPFASPPLRGRGEGEGGIFKPRRIWIITDSVFSMDGDLAPLRELVELKNRHGAYLIVDEAHATGVFGNSGRGVSEHLGVSDQIDVHIGTLSKALGALGGFVAAPSELIEYLINRARSFIFATALPPSICAAAIQAIEIIEREPELRAKLWRNVEKLRRRRSASPIIPIVLGDEHKALEAAGFLFREGFLIPAVRFPAVPRGKARLRVTVSAAHAESEIDRLLSMFREMETSV